MKINLGEKLRNLRKSANMTQEQLADRLGTSCQSVSRWENGTTYPDLELILPLAEIFGVTSDFLLGAPEEKKERETRDIFAKLVEASYEKEVDTEKIISLIREIRLRHLKSTHFHHFWYSVKQSVLCMPEILPEVRITVEAILEGDGHQCDKDRAIRHFSYLECEERIEDFLNKYASEENMSKRDLLFHRYQRQGATEKRNLLRQEFLAEHINQLIGNSAMWHIRNPREECPAEDYEVLRQKNDLCLTLLHQLCGVAPDEQHPISGNGEVDLWIEPRLYMGIEKTYYLSQAGEYAKALVVLEDVVSLLEKAMAITAPTTLGCSSPWLKDIEWKAEESWGQPDNYLPNTEEERMLFLHVYNSINDCCCYCVYPSTYYHMLTARECTNAYTRHAKCLDPLRDKETFLNLTERIRALIVTRPVA